MINKIIDVSVIIVTYNRYNTLCKTLECVLNQNPSPREIIIVDQSEENAIVPSLIQKLNEYKNINYIFQKEPNAQRARNRAIAAARSEILLFIDDDVIMDIDLVEAHWRNYLDPDISGIAGFYLEPGETPLDELPNYCNRPITGWIYTPHCYTKRDQTYLLSTCNASIRRDLAIKIGGFDENYTHTLFDDTDFSCRLKKLNVKVIHDPTASLIHLKEPSGGKRPGGINKYVIADKHQWYIWCYFFMINFGWHGLREIFLRIRSSIFRKVNIIRPWYLILAMMHFVIGLTKALIMIRSGRKLASFSKQINK